MSSNSGDENSWESSSYDSDEHDSDDFVYDSPCDSSSYDYQEEVDIPDDYNPVGVESDDDENECCHWSTNQDKNSSIRVQWTVLQFGVQWTVLQFGVQWTVLQFGKPAKVYLDGSRPCDLVNDVIDNEFLDRVILCTWKK